jgi:hypothetical protein
VNCDRSSLPFIGSAQSDSNQTIRLVTKYPRWCSQVSISKTSAKLRDQVKVAELQNPALGTRYRAAADEVITDNCSNAEAINGGNRIERSKPCRFAFGALKQYRLPESRLLPFQRPRGHQIQHPRASLEAEPDAVSQQY